jgi:hypothetical protein
VVQNILASLADSLEFDRVWEVLEQKPGNILDMEELTIMKAELKNKKPGELVNFEAMDLSVGTAIGKVPNWWFYMDIFLLRGERTKCLIDTGAMAVSLSAVFAARVHTAQERRCIQNGGQPLEEHELALSSLKWLPQKQVFVGFADSSAGGIMVSTQGHFRPRIKQLTGGCALFPWLRIRIIKGQSDDMVWPASVVDSLQIQP